MRYWLEKLFARSQVFKERPATVEEAGNPNRTNMLAQCAKKLTCPWVQIWAGEEKLTF